MELCSAKKYDKIYINGKESTEKELERFYGKERRASVKIKDRVLYVESVKENKISYKSTTQSENVVYILNDKEINSDDFKKISSNDIESITVIKDKEAIAKYGEKAKNGVLIIKTKDYQKNTSTHKKTTEIEKKRNALAEKNQATIENKKAEIEKRKAIIEERKALAENRKSTIENKRAEIENKRAEIENKKAEIEKRKAIIEERKALTENRKSTIENKRAEIERQKTILEERKALAEKKKSLDLLNSIFNNTKEIKKDQEDYDFKITSISASLTQEDGTVITMSENY